MSDTPEPTQADSNANANQAADTADQANVPGTDAHAEAPAEPITPAQAALTQLFAAHGLPGEDYNGWLLPHRQPPGVMANWAASSHGNGLIGTLSVVVRMTDRREIVENFAGIGEGEAGMQDGFSSFADGDLHVLLAGLWNLPGDAANPSVPKVWTCQGGRSYQAFVGPWLLRNDAPLPEGLDAQIQACIEAEPLDQDLHWFRVFVSQFDGRIALETLKDNELWEAGKTLSELPWAQREAFYSARQFLLLQRMD